MTGVLIAEARGPRSRVDTDNLEARDRRRRPRVVALTAGRPAR